MMSIISQLVYPIGMIKFLYFTNGVQAVKLKMYYKAQLYTRAARSVAKLIIPIFWGLFNLI